MVLDNGEEWEPERFQLEYAEDLFSDVPVAWLLVPEGNAKTTLMSGFALYWADYTPEAMVAMAASSRDQCGLLLGQGIGFVKRSPGFADRFRCYEGYRRITALRTDGKVEVFAADERTGDGIFPHLALTDELHRHRTLGLYRTWHGKLDKRGGKLGAISTAGEPGSEFEDARERIRQEAPDVTVKGRHTRAASPAIVLHEHALRPDDDPADMRVVKKANPLKAITIEKLERKHAAPTMTAGHWLRFVCNRPARTEQSAIGEAEWVAAGTDRDFTGEPCDVGLDLGWIMDPTALVPLFTDGDEYVLGAARVLVPPRDGHSLDPDLVQEAFLELNEEHPIRTVVMDPSAGGEQLAYWLERELGVTVVTWSQKPEPMALAATKFTEALRDDRLKHLCDPVLTRHVLNAVAKDTPDGRFRFVRPKRSRSVPDAPQREIDALISAAIVLAHKLADDDAPQIDPDDFHIIRL